MDITIKYRSCRGPIASICSRNLALTPKVNSLTMSQLANNYINCHEQIISKVFYQINILRVFQSSVCLVFYAFLAYRLDPKICRLHSPTYSQIWKYKTPKYFNYNYGHFRLCKSHYQAKAFWNDASKYKFLRLITRL